MARMYDYEIQWTKSTKNGRFMLLVYRVKNGRPVKRLTFKEVDVLCAAGVIVEQRVRDWLKAEKEYKLSKEKEKVEFVGKPKEKPSEEGGFAPGSPELYNYLAGLYKIKTWGNV
jgi:hypothetical protein